jgi:glycosyltransferase involved in cell wall biosynthesis
MALTSKGVNLDVIGSGELDSEELRSRPGLKFIMLHGDQKKPLAKAAKLLNVIAVYIRIVCYAASTKTKVFHILWNYKFPILDRTLMLIYYKALGKKIVFTAHNVNAATRDGNESKLNSLSLKAQYRLVDHIFVHTDKMKLSLMGEFGVKENAVTVIPFGINNSVPDTALTPRQAKERLGINDYEKTFLFFGRIRQYKGLDYLVEALKQIALQDGSYRLIIAGEPKKDSMQYWYDIQRVIKENKIEEQIIQRIGFIADGETEIYFKAADVLVLPYTDVFQSGVLFLAYSFGLPVIATDVGSLRDDIVDGETGYLCRPCDVSDLAQTIERYFESDLFKNLSYRRDDIKAFANARHSWNVVSDKTCMIYDQLLTPANESL